MRLAIGILCVLLALTFAVLAMTIDVPKNDWLLLALSGFFALGALSCVPGKHTALTGRMMGLMVCVFYGCNFVLTIRSLKGEADPLTPLLVICTEFIAIVLPAAFLVVTGRLPGWSELGKLGQKKHT